MAVELVPGYGIRVDGLEDLTFTMGRDEVHAAVTHRHQTTRPFICGTSWTCGWHGDGVTVEVFGGDDQLCQGFQVGREGAYYRHGREGLAAHEPVVYAGVDLFGWPVDDVVDCLRGDGLAVEAGSQVVRVGLDLVLFRWSQPSTPTFDLAMFTSGRPLLR